MSFLDIYKTVSEDDPGIGIWLWVGLVEDMFFTTIRTPEERDALNKKRKKRLVIHVTFLLWQINIRIPLKTVGKKYYGRLLR